MEVVNSVNPVRIEGQKTAAFEICDALGDAPFPFPARGERGEITAYWKGFREYSDAGLSDTLPKMMGWQAAGRRPGIGASCGESRNGGHRHSDWKPASWQGAVEAARDSGDPSAV